MKENHPLSKRLGTPCPRLFPSRVLAEAAILAHYAKDNSIAYCVVRHGYNSYEIEPVLNGVRITRPLAQPVKPLKLEH